MRYLCTLFVKNRALAYLLVGRDGTLIDAGGILAAYGLAEVRSGERPGDALFFIEGLLPLVGDPVFLPRVKVGSGLSADIHLFAGEEGDWVLLLDATMEEACEKLLQQSMNELSLLRRKLEKLSCR